MAQYSLNEVLKARAAQKGEQKSDDGEVKLDDVTRVKVLSPTRKVIKRFKKNRLAMFGAFLLLTMFVISFVGPLFYAWGQTDIFYKNEQLYTTYAQVKKADRFVGVDLTDVKLHTNNNTVLMMNSYITNTMNSQKEGAPALTDYLVFPSESTLKDKRFSDIDKSIFLIRREIDPSRPDSAQIYSLSAVESAKEIAKIGNIEPKLGRIDALPIGVAIKYDEGVELDEALKASIEEAVKKAFSGTVKDKGTVTVGDQELRYEKSGGKSYDLYGAPEETFSYTKEDMGEAFEATVHQAYEEGKNNFTIDETEYVLNYDEKAQNYTVYELGAKTPVQAYTKLSAHLVKGIGALDSNVIRTSVLNAIVSGEDTIELDYVKYHVKVMKESTGEKDDSGTLIMAYRPYVIDEEGFTVQSIDNVFEADDGNSYYVVEHDDGTFTIEDADGNPFPAEKRTYTIVENEEGFDLQDEEGVVIAKLNDYSVKRGTGEDSIEYDMKEKFIENVKQMAASSTKSVQIEGKIPEQDDSGSYVRENGKIVYKDSPIDVVRQSTGEYNFKCNLVMHLIDRFASPSVHHLLGTDGDGFDVLARIMYGGRISLLVGFVVVFLEIILGVIMGGLAGYYGKWVDMLVMRLVDVFYCLPSMPILIIVGAAMDASRLNPYIRLLVMIASLGIMGWAGVARMVRGQILSLREQEFMVAAEATGIKVRSRIFRHLIPNVMPQLIVIATMGMGGVILTESTLSYLGLGVKHPLATWGSMINSVSTATAMKYYPYIWIPVGILICLTVIAFNFVGDGLRDAYDPKSNK